MLDHREIVADEEIGEAEVAPQLGQQVQDLRLHRDVERAGRLVAHHDARPQHQRAGDRDPLALAARQLGRAGGRPISAVRPTRASISSTRLAISAAREGALRHQRHGDDVADAGQRIERGEGVLEHRLDQPRAGLAVHVGDALALDRRCRPSRLAAGRGSGGRAWTCRSPIRPRCPARRRPAPRRRRRRPPRPCGPPEARLDAEGLARRCGPRSRRSSCAAAGSRKSWVGARAMARHGVGAGRVGEVAAVAEGAAFEARADARHGAGDRAERLVAPGSCPAPARSAAGPACRDAWDWRTARRSARSRPLRRHTSPTRGGRRGPRCRDHG